MVSLVNPVTLAIDFWCLFIVLFEQNAADYTFKELAQKEDAEPNSKQTKVKAKSKKDKKKMDLENLKREVEMVSTSCNNKIFTTRLSLSQPVRDTVSESVSQWASQPVRQPVSQLVRQSISWYDRMHPTLRFALHMSTFQMWRINKKNMYIIVYKKTKIDADANIQACMLGYFH